MIERFDVDEYGDLREFQDGKFVRYSDHAAEVERLIANYSDLEAGKATITDIAVRNGSMTLACASETAGFMANQFFAALGEAGAQNYLEMNFHSKDGKHVTVTIRREYGKTPHQLKAEAEAARDALTAENAALKEAHKRAVDGWTLEGQDLKVAEQKNEELRADLTTARARIAELEGVLKAIAEVKHQPLTSEVPVLVATGAMLSECIRRAKSALSTQAPSK